MAEVLPRHYIYGTIMFIFFIVGITALLTQINSYDSTALDDPRYQEFNNSFNKLEELNRSMSSLENSLKSEEAGDQGAFGQLNALISTGWNTLKNLPTILGFAITAMYGLVTVFGIPGWIITIIGLLVSIMILFAIYSAIFQREI